MDEYNNLSSEDQNKIAPELVDKLMKAYDKIQELIVEDIAGKFGCIWVNHTTTL